MTFDKVGQIAMALAGVEVGISYGAPALKVGGKLIARRREDGETLVSFDVPNEERVVMVEAEPEVYVFTDHYRDWLLSWRGSARRRRIMCAATSSARGASARPSV